LLNVSTRSLSEYESGRRAVPDDIVAKMIEVYGDQSLMWWHWKHFSPLGRYLPDVQIPKTAGDMAHQLWLARNKLVPTVDEAMELLGEGIYSGNSECFTNAMQKVSQVKSILLSSTIFSQKLVAS
jgi:hypothetical protein